MNGTVKAVRDVSFDLHTGETLAIVGESGSGKSVTSRAVMGILAGNSIVEGGEILYDGQDLLKISEDDFHKIRGDKIAMIFQDPMSSLNPIMKVGKQLTEAMILKGKSSQKNARKTFNTKLKLLNESIDEVMTAEGKSAAEIKNNAEQCKTFDSFCIMSKKLEDKFNTAVRRADETVAEIADVLFLIEKKQKVDAKRVIASIVKGAEASIHPAVVPESEEIRALLTAIAEAPKAPALAEEIAAVSAAGTLDAIVTGGTLAKLQELKGILAEATKKEKPNYFTLGYYILKNPEADLSAIPMAELNAMTRKYLDEDFMLAFIDLMQIGVKHSFEKSLAKKKALVAKLHDAIDFFRAETLDEKATRALIASLASEVEGAIDKLAVKKDSDEFTFRSSMNNFADKYFIGVKKNPKEQARFDKQTEKRKRLIESGKAPDWKVVPAVLVDLELTKKNIRQILRRLEANYTAQVENEKNYDAKARSIELIDFLKEQASAVAYTVTPRMAKMRALKLLEEVGIPEPAIRYNQYPFEFSGGMRQRIVIAIALAADPDILICDEPTTALDVTIQSQILELINRLKVERNLTVIFITHDLGVVANMADRIAVMYAGKIVEYGTSDDIFYDPRHPYTWALLSSMPDLDTKEKLEAIPGTPPNMIYPPKGDAFAARNRYALEIDFEEQPPMIEVSETHSAATWLLHPNAPKVDPPKIVTDRIERMSAEVKKND